MIILGKPYLSPQKLSYKRFQNAFFKGLVQKNWYTKRAIKKESPVAFFFPNKCDVLKLILYSFLLTEVLTKNTGGTITRLQAV